MSSFAVLRLRKRSLGSASAMARHALRDGGHEVRNADPERAALNRVLVGPCRAADAVQELRAALPAKRRKDAVEAIEFLITASPEALRGRSVKAQDAYFEDALAWIGQRFGGAQNVRLAVIHRDETTPHLQVLLTPMLDGKLAGSKLCGGPAQMRKMQTDFAAEVGKRHGLQRGLERVPGEGRPAYQSIRRWYAAIAAVGGVDRIPAVRPVPDVPPEPKAPGVMARLKGLINPEGEAEAQKAHQRALAAHKRALVARNEAVQANRARTQLINRLASIGLAAYGKDARSVGERLARAAETEAVAQKVYEDKRQAYDGLSERYQSTEAALQALENERASLEREVQARREVLQLGELESYRGQLEAEIRDLEQQLGISPQHRPR